MLPELLWRPAPDQRESPVDGLRQLIRDANVAPGASAAAAVRIGEVFHAFPLYCGSRRWDGLEPIVGNEWYDLASVTKSVFALVLARLVQRGNIRFDSRLEIYLPWARGTAAGGATLENLLAHRAGLTAHVEFFSPLREGRSFSRDGALREAADSTRASTEVGESLYSDLGYLLLGEAVRSPENHEALGDVVVRELHALGLSELAPIRLLTPALRARVVPTENVEWRGGEVRALVHDDNAFAFGGTDMCGHAGLFGTASGVLRFACTLLDICSGRHPLVPTEDLEILLRRRPGGTLRAGFDGKSARGSSAGQLLSKDAFGHLGFTGTSFWCDPTQQIAVVLLSNRVCPNRNNPSIKQARPLVHDLLVERALSLRDTSGLIT